jgi:serine/threonine-protein kinase RsbW
LTAFGTPATSAHGSPADDPAAEPSGAAGDLIELWIPARAARLGTVRAVAADLAGRLDFDLDAVADLRMAVDEAGASLLPAAAEGARLVCAFTVGQDEITVEVAVQGRPGSAVDTDGFGWRVLHTLVDELDVLPAQRAPEIGVRLTKRRTGSAR